MILRPDPNARRRVPASPTTAQTIVGQVTKSAGAKTMDCPPAFVAGIIAAIESVILLPPLRS
jgi:hypothetical protein